MKQSELHKHADAVQQERPHLVVKCGQHMVGFLQDAVTATAALMERMLADSTGEWNHLGSGALEAEYGSSL
jgi:hypothetical protein